jgi:hypothetical protein
MGRNPLTGVEEVNWANLTHAYGPAVDVPDLLERLTESHSASRAALRELYGNIWHQGTVYEATAPAVPFLVSIAVENAEVRPSLVGLIAEIAAGSSYLEAHEGVIRGEVPRGDKSQELEWVKAARDAVHERLPELIGALVEPPTKASAVALARVGSTENRRGRAVNRTR